ncbi:hypothetical protein PAXRUDRAFT_20268 [Paxillus rubicundulus Ve08.2h10]|uniref:Uncharacterized protein n=1 Tax=Paxillus rubicundulus Ve08.2h10 TaxID=930991 RepID=A0A0D0DA34_9AGAM|nr:hypothetical protein PAXRUDRAFT_20268 [Paxillus rubicundulus Ve08.2h10]
MSSSTTNDLSKWSDEQLRENEDNDDELFEKKSAEQAKRKVEVEAQRRAEVEAKVHAEEVARAQSFTSGPSKKAQTKSLMAEDDKEDTEDREAEENRDVLSALAEVLSAMVGEMWNMAADRRRAVAESHAQMERVLGTLEEIQGCLDPKFVPEEGSEEDFEEGEVAEAAEEREALKGRNKEEEEVDESV